MRGPNLSRVDILYSRLMAYSRIYYTSKSVKRCSDRFHYFEKHDDDDRKKEQRARNIRSEVI